MLPSGRAGRSCDKSEAKGSGTSPPADVFQGVQLNIDLGEGEWGGGGCRPINVLKGVQLMTERNSSHNGHFMSSITHCRLIISLITCSKLDGRGQCSLIIKILLVCGHINFVDS